MKRDLTPAKDYIAAIPNAERRFFAHGIEVRQSNPGEPVVFRGYAAKFNTLSEDLGGFKERIAPSFFDNVLGSDVRILKNHDPHYILGRTSSGTAKVGVDAVGLWYEWTDPNTSYSRDLAISINRGDISQSSFAFSLASDGKGDQWDKQKDGTWIRTLMNAGDLFDASPVTYPAYQDTSVAGRSLAKQKIKIGGERSSAFNAQDSSFATQLLAIINSAVELVNAQKDAGINTDMILVADEFVECTADILDELNEFVADPTAPEDDDAEETERKKRDIQEGINQANDLLEMEHELMNMELRTLHK